MMVDDDDDQLYDQHFAADDRRLDKEERKRAQARDRSKYKKTDQAKVKGKAALHPNIKVAPEDLLRGRVLSIMSQGMLVEADGKEWVCVLRGLLKKDKTLLRRIVTVGDFVLFEAINDDEGLIAHVEPRKTVLSRADNLSRIKEQVIAANIDQVLITVSVVEPPLKPSLVDRYVIATVKGGMTPVILVNKIDLLATEATAEERQLYEEFIPAYRSAGYQVLPVSVETGEGLESVKLAMTDRASVFSGQSGAGKSSLINALLGTSLATGATVSRSRKGAHTTTATQLLPLSFGGWCIDTPGIKSFGVWDLDKEDIEAYFPDIHSIGEGCQYSDCSHTHEAECAVLVAMKAGELPAIRYLSYLALLDDADREHRRR